jgi:hypothetical protein
MIPYKPLASPLGRGPEAAGLANGAAAKIASYRRIDDELERRIVIGLKAGKFEAQ